MRIVSDSQFEPENDPSDRALDQLLSQAHWPAPTEEMRSGIESRWRTIAWRHRLKPAIWCVAVAAAAVIACVLGSQILLLQERWRRAQIVDLQVDTDVKYFTVVPDEPGGEAIVSRPANLLERAALLQRPVRPERKVDLPFKAPIAWVSDLGSDEPGNPGDVSELLKEVADPATQSAALVRVKAMADPPVNPLLDRLTSPSLDERFAAATALAALDSPVVVELLVERAQRNPGQREALIALGLSGHPLAEQALSTMDLSSATRAQLLADTSQLRKSIRTFNPQS